jgi:hypothetical protein
MKKILLFVISILIWGGISVKAQDSRTVNQKKADEYIAKHHLEDEYSDFWIRSGFSYDFGMGYYDPCDYYDEDEGLTYDYLTTIDYDPFTGMNYDLWGGYNVTRNISFTMGFEGQKGWNINQSRSGIFNGSSYSEKVTWSSWMLSFQPGVEASVDLGSKWKPFCDVSAVIGFFPQINMKVTNINTSGTSKDNSSSTTTEIVQSGIYHGRIPIGFDIRAGVYYKLSKMLNLYAALDFRGLNYNPKKYSMKKYTVNGVDEFSTLTTKSKEIIFVKSYDNKETIPSDSPNKQLEQTFPFTGIGLNIGILINLGKWENL